MKVELIDGPGPAWEACEARLDERLTPLPLYHRAIWARARGASGVSHTLVAIRSETGDCLAAFAIESGRSRALPGHRLLRIRRLGVGGGGLDETTLDAGLAAVAARVKEDRRVLRVTVEVFSLESENRRQTSEVLRRRGFIQAAAMRSYDRTLVLDLEPPEEKLFAGLHKNARQGVRNVARFPVRVSPATSAAVAPRLQDIADETRDRTGGENYPVEWPAIVEMSARAPQLSRIVLLERNDRSGPDAVIAFAWGCLHGNVAEYSESGSVRVEDMKISTSYALLWDLIVWAKRAGARWFDFGGITSGSTGGADPLGGISDFKRRFSEMEIEVGEEWEMTPHRRRAAIARAVSAVVGWLRARMRRRS